MGRLHAARLRYSIRILDIRFQYKFNTGSVDKITMKIYFIKITL